MDCHSKEAISSSLEPNNDPDMLVTEIKEIRSTLCGIIGRIDVTFVEGDNESIFGSYFDTSVVLAFEMVGKDVRDEMKSKHLAFAESSYKKLLQNAIVACRNGLCSSTTPLLIMDELFESIPINECESIWKIFSSFQKEFSLLLRNDKKGASLTTLAILKLVNSLLRRTCIMRDSSFRGSMMMYSFRKVII